MLVVSSDSAQLAQRIVSLRTEGTDSHSPGDMDLIPG